MIQDPPKILNSATYVCGDTAQWLEDLLEFGGAVVPLTGATVVCRFYDLSLGLYAQVDADVEDIPTGEVRVDGDALAEAITEPGRYLQNWFVTLQTGKTQTVPNNGYNLVVAIDPLTS